MHFSYKMTKIRFTNQSLQFWIRAVSNRQNHRIAVHACTNVSQAHASVWDRADPKLVTLIERILVILKSSCMFKYTIWIRKLISFDLDRSQVRCMSFTLTFPFFEIFEVSTTYSYLSQLSMRGLQWYLTIQKSKQKRPSYNIKQFWCRSSWSYFHLRKSLAKLREAQGWNHQFGAYQESDQESDFKKKTSSEKKTR